MATRSTIRDRDLGLLRYDAGVIFHEVVRTGTRTFVVESGTSNVVRSLEGETVWAPDPAIGPCYLNGVAADDGEVVAVTALHVPRTEPRMSGLLLGADGKEIRRDLSMPHSPRLHDGALWFLESGRGLLRRLTPEGEVETVAEFPGFARGLCFVDGSIFVGVCRDRKTVADPEAASAPAAVFQVDPSGRVERWATLDGPDVFDIQAGVL